MNVVERNYLKTKLGKPKNPSNFSNPSNSSCSVYQWPRCPCPLVGDGMRIFFSKNSHHEQSITYNIGKIVITDVNLQ